MSEYLLHNSQYSFLSKECVYLNSPEKTTCKSKKGNASNYDTHDGTGSETRRLRTSTRLR
jgi:hypothetical protein